MKRLKKWLERLSEYPIVDLELSKEEQKKLKTKIDDVFRKLKNMRA